MEIVELHKPLVLNCIEACSFPEGVSHCHDQLKRMKMNEKAAVYGISYPTGIKGIRYLAGTSGKLTSSEEVVRFVIDKGYFIAVTVKQWRTNLHQVKASFEKLTSDSRVETNGYCLEEYIGDDMRCLVPIKRKGDEPDWRDRLRQDISTTFENLQKELASFSEQTLNQVPATGGWTAAQVARHVIKSGYGIPDSTTAAAERFPDQKVKAIETMFLDFTVKFQADPFLHPEKNFYDSREIIPKCGELAHIHIQKAVSEDLDALCLDMELPVFGYLTRYEWLRFVLVHTQRHTQQIKNIHAALNEPYSA